MGLLASDPFPAYRPAEHSALVLCDNKGGDLGPDAVLPPSIFAFCALT